MKLLICLFMVLTVSFAYASGEIADFDYHLTDLSSKGLRKEDLFAKMERSMLDLERSICANRAHLWAYDFFREHNINTGKIFIFFGSSIWTDKDKHGYMYHVAPYILENGKEFVMEAGYPSEVKRPLTVNEWIENETYDRVSARDCLEINSNDTDLTEYFYERINLPEKRSGGKTGARCYIRKVPGHYWFPTSIALHDLRKDEEGNSIDFDPKTFDKNDVLEACIEAASTKLGRLFGGGKAKCKAHLKL